MVVVYVDAPALRGRLVDELPEHLTAGYHRCRTGRGKSLQNVPAGAILARKTMVFHGGRL
jgi:hypothetical protein